MVTRLALILLAAVLIPRLAWAEKRCTPGSEFEPPLCPLVLPAIVRVTIEKNAVKSPVSRDPAVDCSRFILTDRLVRRYLTRARVVPEGAGHSELDWSPCYAEGTVLFSDGRTASWSVAEFRVGWLLFEGHPGQTLYCPKCVEKPYVW